MPEYGFDEETGQFRQRLGFEEKSRRMAFVRKVLGTVTLQLFFCASITAACVLSSDSGKEWIKDHYWIAFIGLIVFFIIQCMVVCCGVGAGPPNPCNIALIIIATISLSVFCAFITVYYERETILYALACTVLVLIIVVVVTVCTPIDITGWGLMLCCAGIALTLATFMVILVLALSQPSRETSRVILLVLLALFIVILTVYILYDLQLIIGGQGRKYQLGEGEWLLASICLFGDIVHLFLILLQFIGLARS